MHCTASDVTRQVDAVIGPRASKQPTNYSRSNTGLEDISLAELVSNNTLSPMLTTHNSKIDTAATATNFDDDSPAQYSRAATCFRSQCEGAHPDVDVMLLP